MSRLVVAALVLLLSVSGLLGAAAWNRAGDVQFVTLTERELALPGTWTSGVADGEPELRLRVEWQRRDDPVDARAWLADLTLRELGFTVGVPAGAPEAARVYGRSLPRLAWVAFEYDGPAWRLIEQRAQARAPDERRGPVTAWSRLVPIDASADREMLRRRHRDAPVIVLPAVMAMRYVDHPTRGPSVWGVVQSLVPGDVSVPFRLRERLRPLRGAPPARPAPGPRYDVVLGVGRFSMWIADLRVRDHRRIESPGD